MTRGWANHPRGAYPQAWHEGKIQQRMYQWAGWRCEHCGMEFEPGTTQAKYARRRDGQPMTLTVHHLSGDCSDCSKRNLLVCCQICHLHIQSLWCPGEVLPLAWNNQPPAWLTRRKLPYKINPQLKLFEDM